MNLLDAANKFCEKFGFNKNSSVRDEAKRKYIKTSKKTRRIARIGSKNKSKSI